MSHYIKVPPSKRHRLDPAVTTPPWQLLGGLPNEVLLRIVSFSGPNARLKVAHTCRACWKAVEEHEKRVYEQIKRTHRVDDTFDARVGDQTNLGTSITGRAKPVDLPYRYRKIVAMKTSLYSLALSDGENDMRQPLEMVVSPSGDRIVVTTTPAQDPRVYDLSNRRLEATLIHVHPVRGALFLDDGRILTYGSRGLYTWTLSESGADWDGQMFLPREAVGEIVDWSRNGQEIFAVTHDYDDPRLTLLSINIGERSVRSTVVGEGAAFNITEDLEIVGLSSTKWLLFQDTSAWGTHTDAASQCFFLAYNIETKQTSRFFSRTENYVEDVFTPVHQMSCCSRTFCAINDERLLVYDLEDDGHLAERFSFPVLVDDGRDRFMWLRADYRSHVFVAIGYKYMKAFDVDTGECVRSMSPFGNGSRGVIQSVAVAIRRKELLFLGRDENIEFRVKAFCLEEPCIV